MKQPGYAPIEHHACDARSRERAEESGLAPLSFEAASQPPCWLSDPAADHAGELAADLREEARRATARREISHRKKQPASRQSRN